MTDKIKTSIAFLFFTSSVIFPLVGIFSLLASWVGLIEIDSGGAIAFIVLSFLTLFSLGGLMLFWVKDPTWLTVSLPYLFGALYSILPDFIPFPIDDAAAVTAGAIFSSLLALRKNPNTPKWIFVPLLAAGVYAFFGGTIPGPIDEFIVEGAALLIAAYGANKAPD